MKRCFAYIRVSTARQKEQASSLTEQRSAILRYAERQDLQIVEWFEEVQTAAKRGRTVFAKIVRRLRAGEAEGLIMHKIDRSSRNYYDWAEISELADRGISVYFASENLELSSRGRRLMADIQAVVATDYIRNLRDEIHKGIAGRLKEGLLPGGAPTGYRDHGRGGKVKTICPLYGPLVRLAFELYATGNYTLETLLDDLHRRGLRSKRGTLSLNSLSLLLRNKFYIGLLVSRRTRQVHQGVHEPLVPVHLFTRVGQLLESRMRRKRLRNEFLYSRLFACASCGHSLIAEQQKGHVYYRCHGKACRGTSVREESLEAAVTRAYATLTLTETQRKLVGQYLALFAEGSSKDSADHETLQLAAIQQRHDRLVDAYVDGMVDQATFAARKERLFIEKRTVEERAGVAVNRHAVSERARLALELAGSALLSHQRASDVEKRQLLRMLTSNRTVDGKKAVVELSFPFDGLAKAANFLSGARIRGTPRTVRPQCHRGRTSTKARIPRPLKHVFKRLYDYLGEHPDALVAAPEVRNLRQF